MMDLLANTFNVWSSLGLVALYLLPLLLAIFFWKLYLIYIQTDYLSKLNWLLLEIKLPAEVTKSPAAMEMVLTALHQPAAGNLKDQYADGRVRPWFSLELVSLGGAVHFYIHTQDKFKNAIESQIYSQYPTAEVYEVDDYTQFVPYGAPGSTWSIWGLEFQFTKDDPYPIRTYVDYGLDKDPKEEYKVDPLTPILELLGSLGREEQMWIQIPVMATVDRRKKAGSWFGKEGWKEQGKAEIKKIMEKYAKEDETGKKSVELPRVPKYEQDVIDAISRNVSKYGFDCGIRAIYLAPDEHFVGTNIPRMIGGLKQFGSQNLNGFKPLRVSSFEYPWQDPFGSRAAYVKRQMFEAYRRRGYFYWPFKSHKFMVMNTEELATIYHFPGQVAETPTLSRIPSKRGEPPANLPLGR